MLLGRAACTPSIREALASLRTYFERFWTEALAAFKQRVEVEAKKKG
jgi:hypothetical protein